MISERPAEGEEKSVPSKVQMLYDDHEDEVDFLEQLAKATRLGLSLHCSSCDNSLKEHR